MHGGRQRAHRSETDWDRIIGLYDLLGSLGANPVVTLNRAVAVTERDGPQHCGSCSCEPQL
ncbi:MAG TPA: hypothetical protein VMD59_00480 [Acidimicrobiales bacterium]|nr:hypothetical protein [Acidimicrobiales bacterium]